MSDAIQELARRIASGEILQQSAFPSDDSSLNAALESRYSPEFEDEWLRVARDLEVLSIGKELPQHELEAIQRAVYEKVFSFAPNPELCSLVSDDFELFGQALTLNYNDPWLVALLKSYIDGKFPYRVSPIKTSMAAMLGCNSDLEKK